MKHSLLRDDFSAGAIREMAQAFGPVTLPQASSIYLTSKFLHVLDAATMFSIRVAMLQLCDCKAHYSYWASKPSRKQNHDSRMKERSPPYQVIVN